MNLSGVYAIWLREMLIFFREKPRIISAVINPIFWLLTFGVGLGATVNIAGVNYEQYIFPGILMQTFLFSSIFYGAYLVWDRRIDLLKAVLVTPLNRSAIFLGKVLGGVTFSLIEAAIILAFGVTININYTLTSIPLILITVTIQQIILRIPRTILIISKLLPLERRIFINYLKVKRNIILIEAIKLSDI